MILKYQAQYHLVKNLTSANLHQKITYKENRLV